MTSVSRNLHEARSLIHAVTDVVSLAFMVGADGNRKSLANTHLQPVERVDIRSKPVAGENIRSKPVERENIRSKPVEGENI